MQVRGKIGVVTTLALVATLASCGADPNDTPGAVLSAAPGRPRAAGTYPANGEQAKVVALDNNFLREETDIVAGTEVVFSNNGRNPHNIVPADDPKATTWGVHEDQFQPTASYSHVFDTPGAYVYYCTIHGSAKAGMVGRIIVTKP